MHLLIVSMEAPLNGFLKGDNELVYDPSFMLISPGNIFLKTCYNI